MMKINYRVLNFLRCTVDPFALGAPGLEGNPMIAACDANGITYVRVVSSLASAGAPAVSAPGAGGTASVTLPADLNRKYNAISISWSVGDTAAMAVPRTLVLRDGASGVGTILWSKVIGPILAGDSKQGDITWPAGYGPSNAAVNTAMTLEFTTAPAGTGFESVSLVAYKSLA